jgi:hypothetical protein
MSNSFTVLTPHPALSPRERESASGLLEGSEVADFVGRVRWFGHRSDVFAESNRH